MRNRAFASNCHPWRRSRLPIHFARTMITGVRTWHHHHHLLSQCSVSCFSSSGGLESSSSDNPIADPDFSSSIRVQRILAQKYPDLCTKGFLDTFTLAIERFELRVSLEDDPNPLNLTPVELTVLKKNPGVQIHELDHLVWMQLHPDSYIEEMMPSWFPWWTSRTEYRCEFSTLVTRTPVPSAEEDPEFTMLAHLAISEHKKREDAHLEFVRLEGVCAQHNNRFNKCSYYFIIFEARDNAAAGGEKVARDNVSKTTRFLRTVPVMQHPPVLPEVSGER